MVLSMKMLLVVTRVNPGAYTEVKPGATMGNGEKLVLHIYIQYMSRTSYEEIK